MDSAASIPSGPPKPDEDGNYDSPALATLRRVWDDYCEEIATPDDVMGVIAEIGGFSQFQLQVLERQVEQGVSNPEDDSFSLIYEAFEILLEACDFMSFEFAEELPEGVVEPEEGFFSHGFDLVQEATNQMMEGHAIGMEHIEAMAEVNCPFCQHVNSRDDSKCGRCGRALPMTAPSGPESGGAVNVVEHVGLENQASESDGEFTRNYVQTVEILEGWKAKAVSPAQLREFLDKLEETFLAHLGETQLHEETIRRAPQEKQEALMEALEKTREGLQMSLDSVAKMRSAFDLEDDRYLFFGLSDLEAASKVMVEAYWANKDAAKG